MMLSSDAFRDDFEGKEDIVIVQHGGPERFRTGTLYSCSLRISTLLQYRALRNDRSNSDRQCTPEAKPPSPMNVDVPVEVDISHYSLLA